MSTLAGPADGGPGFSRHRLGRPDHPTTHDASIESKYLVIKPDPTFRLDIVLTRMLNNANIAGGEARSKGKGGQVSISLGGRGEPTPL